MTNERSAETAAELDELQADLRKMADGVARLAVKWGGEAGSTFAKAADAIASLRKQLDEAREQRNFYIDAMAEAEKREAQMAAALDAARWRFLEIASRRAYQPALHAQSGADEITKALAASPSPVLRDADTAPAPATVPPLERYPHCEPREFALITSYCGDDTPGCTDKTPCADCLAMCNVFDENGKYLRQLGKAPAP